MAQKFHIATFGCRTNQADSAAIRESFLESQMTETDQPVEADIIVINSCTVTHRSDQQVRQLTRKFRRENRNARILLTGCYAQREPERLSRIQGISALVGNTHKDGLVEIADELGPQTQAPQLFVDDFQKVRRIDLSPGRVGGKTRPFVKIQDGCDAKCSYCIIPAVRGPSRSVPPAQILKQVSELTAAGFREIVLTGIHIGTYGMYLQPRYPLDRLVREITEIPGLVQLRLSSIEPMELSKKIIELAAQSEKIAPHFHICLQSGSDRILKKMLRPYDTARFLEIIQEIRVKIPEAAIGTDLIVGFPGETRADHRQTLDFVREAPFTYLHVFPYSDRSGTRASKMSHKVHSRTIKRRSAELRDLSAEKNSRFRSQFMGRRLKILTLTNESNGMREGISGNYLKVLLEGSVPGNRIVEATIEGESEERLIGGNVRQVK